MRLGPAVLVLCLAAACATASAPSAEVLPSGSWGGEHLLMTVTDSGAATLEFDCASGGVAAPLHVRSDGTFQWRGFFSPGHGGPIRQDEVFEKKPATFTGVRNGDLMLLRMAVDDGTTPQQSYELVRGRAAHVFKCL